MAETTEQRESFPKSENTRQDVEERGKMKVDSKVVVRYEIKDDGDNWILISHYKKF
jgi:hypothetical protein